MVIDEMHSCIVSLTLRKCQSFGQKTVNLPLFREVSIFSLVVLLFSVAFTIFWVATTAIIFMDRPRYSLSTFTLCCYKDNNTAMAALVSTIGAVKGTLINGRCISR
ncbi:signal peptide peptidase-like 3 isoform X4 [Arachis hypogaea]|uniref:signal peptide peptidase-like 3 isoform X4 n=1 Tax=Arachis hypogaea TaxID=3818 RepID=UPI003B213197